MLRIPSHDIELIGDEWKLVILFLILRFMNSPELNLLTLENQITPHDTLCFAMIEMG
jgi:hypothetical protein